MVVIAAYAPTDSATDTEKIEFFTNLTNLLDQIGNRKEIYLMGDFNGKVGRQYGRNVVGTFGEDAKNGNGERLIDMCEQYKLKIWNVFFFSTKLSINTPGLNHQGNYTL